jgi:seryl-tRNA synthetase
MIKGKNMLEKSDLQQIGLLLDDKLAPIKQELHSVMLEIEEIKLTLARIDKRTDEDTSAAFVEIEKLKKQVLELENKVKIIETQRI